MPSFEKRVVDPRVIATRSICRSAIAIFAISVPLIIFVKLMWLPLAVLGGTALAVSSVWFFGRSKVVATHSKEIAALETTIADLKERLENVEVITRYEASLLEEDVAEGARKMGSPAEL